MSPSLMRSYYHGEYAWQDRVLDVSEACEASVDLQRKSLQLEAQGQKAAQDLQIEQQRAAREQHEEMRSIAEAQSAELMDIRAGQGIIADAIRQGMSLIGDRLDKQSLVFSQAVTKLGEISQTLRTPRATEANELYDQGTRWFNQGLFEESLDAFLKAEQIYKVNYALQFRIGSLFLEGRNRKSNVIDISRAEPHLLLAARYAEAKDPSDSVTRRICGDAYFRAGKAASLLGRERRKMGDLEGVQDCLQRALGHLAKSVELWPENTPIVYWEAKCHAVLGRKREVLEKFAILSDRNRKHYADAMADPDRDFEFLKDEIDEVFKRATESPGPQARMAKAQLAAVQARLSQALEAVGWAQMSTARPESQTARLQEIGTMLSNAEKDLPGLDIDIEGLLRALYRTHCEMGDIRRELDGQTELTFKARVSALEQELSQLHSQKANLENRIESYKRQMTQTSGSGAVGWLSVVVFVVFLQKLLDVVRSLWYDELIRMPMGMGPNLLALAVFVGWLILGYRTGIWISRSVRNKPLKAQLAAAVGSLADWERTSPPAIQKTKADLEKLTEQMNQFTRWRNSNSAVTLAS